MISWAKVVFLTLAVRRGADERLHLARWRNADDGAFPESALEADGAGNLARPEAADFAIGRNADAQETAIAARFGLLAAKVVIADHRQCLVQRRLVIAAVIREADGHIVPIHKWRDEVDAPQLDGVHLQRLRGLIHQPLDEKSRFGAAGAAVGVYRRGVGENADRFAINLREGVGAAVHQAMQDGGDARPGGAQVSAEARIDRAADARHLTVVHHRQLDVFDMVTPVDGGDVILGACLRPFHRPAGLHRSPGSERFVGVDGDLGAEAAAHFRRDNADFMLRHTRHTADEQAVDVRVLRRAPERQLPGGAVPLRQGRARLHCRRLQALLDDALADDDIGRVKSGVHGRFIAIGDPGEGDVVGDAVMQLRRAISGGFLRG